MRVTRSGRQVHAMHLDERPYSLIRDDSKTVEIRVNDKARRAVRVDDLVLFRYEHEVLVTRVRRVARYPDFHELFEHESAARIDPQAGITEQLRRLREIYPPHREALGVVALEVERVQPLPGDNSALGKRGR